MDLLTRKDFQELAQAEHERSVSIYIPTFRAGRDTDQNPIRLKNALQKVKNQLEEQGVDSSEIRKLLQPAQNLVEDYDFWQHQRDGLALFLADGKFHWFRLPGKFQETVRLDDHFYVTPLVSQFQGKGKFFVLAVSQNDCRLLCGDHDHLEEVSEAKLPADMKSALGYWRQSNLNFHSMQARPQSRAGGETAMYHGHYVDQTETDLKHYFRKIDEGVAEALHGETAPLLFAGVEYLFPVYKEVNSYPHLHGEAVTGNQDASSEKELHSAAWKIAAPLFRTREEEILNRYHELESQGMATADLNTIDAAAREGLVDTLIIPSNASLWGQFDDKTGQLIDTAPQKDDQHTEDLFDRDVMFTLQNSGQVLTVEGDALKENELALAILRAPKSAVATAGK
ncbi:MAG: hypothetical protein CMJ46_08015 [Planctomyces sp.]|nr:hypothetical protein [Planctomyces sp.]